MLTSCLEETIFTVQFPQSGALYVDDELVDFVISYTTPVSGMDVYLNGTHIGNQFSYGPTQATVSISKIEKYIRQGSNTLTVDPLAFGPTVSFSADTEGPDIVVTKGITTGNSVELGGLLRDPSEVVSASIQLWRVLSIDSNTGAVTRIPGPTSYNLPIDEDNNFYLPSMDVSGGVDIYRLIATDVHGHTTQKEYLVDNSEQTSMAISNALRMAIGDSFVASLRPVIAAALYASVQERPIDVRNVCWNDANKDEGASQNPAGGFCATNGGAGSGTAEDGSTFPPGLNPITVSMLGLTIPTTMTRMYMDSNSTMLLNDFSVLENNRLYVNMDITSVQVDLDLVVSILFITLNVSMGMHIADIDVETEAIASVVNKKMDVQLDPDASVFGLNGITVTNANVGGLDLTGIVNFIIPILEGLIGDLLPSILNPILADNLNKIVIGGRVLDLEDQNIEYFDWAANLETLKTDNPFGPGSTQPWDLIVGMETVFDILTQDANVTPVLGPTYVEDPVDTSLIFNSLGDTGTNLSLALSSNAMNQAFNSLYGSGLTHLSIVDGVTTNGADDTQPVGTIDGQTRTRLFPDAPPFFTLRRVEGGAAGETEASIGYESATLFLDTWNSDISQWETELAIGVDFSIAASLVQIDDTVKLGVAGSPIFNVNWIENNTFLPVTASMLQSLMDIVTVYALPELTDNFIIIDLGTIFENDINGTWVVYQDSQDTGDQRYDLTRPCSDPQTMQCYTNGMGTFRHVCDGNPNLDDPGSPIQSGLDLVCEQIDFVVSTNAVTSTGDIGSNLFFQMEARDPDIPPAAAIPRMDLDEDTVLDYQDNCAPPTLMLAAATTLVGLTIAQDFDNDGKGTCAEDPAATVDTDGNPCGTFETDIKDIIERWLAYEEDPANCTGGTAGDWRNSPPTAPTCTVQAASATEESLVEQPA